MIKTVFIGFGYRGQQLYALMQRTGCFDITGVADCRACGNAAGPAFYQGEHAYIRMLDELKPQLAVITTPWHLHVEQATECARRGCHVALEIKGGMALGEYDTLAQAARSTGACVYPMENTMFMREILAVKRMADEGALGDIVYMRGGYRHDLRDILLDRHGTLGGRTGTESVWRSRFYTSRNGDIYPTHGLAPLCLILGIGRRDRLAWLTSFASKAAGLRQRMRELGNDSGDADSITLGDIVSTQIETEGGTLISLTHDTTLPRPRSLDFEVQGTRGVWDGVNRRIYTEGMAGGETWHDDEPYIAQYESRDWQEWGKEALRCDSHHHGMDYIMLRAIAAACRGEAAYPATLSDLALWTSVSVLSEMSINEHRRMKFGRQ